MTGDGSTIKSRIRNLLRSPSTKRKKNRNEDFAKVMLERVLGVTAAGNCGLACDPHSGLVAYPAGCVVVLLNPKKNKQHHILNTSRKAITALCFSPDGRHLVTGESGHLPAVRVWDVTERRQVAELQEHKYGVSCVAFSPNSKYIVSVGYQHDMMVNVWAWKKDIIVAANKVSSKVTAVSFSEDNSYFVTAGNRHVRFWYLDHSKPTKASAPVPLLGRSGLLGELRNNFFCDVACGRGSTAGSTFCITSSGLLCEFNGKRTLDKWVDLRTSAAHSLSVSDELIFCGCGDGTVRAFSPVDLRFVCTLPRPHPLGTDVSSVTRASHLFSNKMSARYPDATAMIFDPVSRWLSCMYNDHSLFVWDVRDPHRVGKVHSALYHASCVWDLQLFPEVPEGSETGLSSCRFFSCSADNTIRLWTVEEPGQTHTHFQRNVLSNDLLKVIYVDDNTATLLDTEGTTCVNTEKGDGQTAENRTGIRTICVSPDGQHLASGDRNGVLRVHNLQSFEEIQKVVAHDSEILCLEYSKPETGLRLLVSASRDRLIHVLDCEEDYGLVQTLDEHSSSITAVRFAVVDNLVRMISCGADKSIYFRTAHRSDGVTEFRRSHHAVMKTTLYDMDVDPTCRFAAVGCQDRCIRIFNVISGKQKKIYKGSVSEDGCLLKLQTDPSGLYVATSCSDKNICIFDFQTGECVATMFGHSEIVTAMRFTNDCKHLISASGDSCIFVWRLAPELTANMKERLCQLRKMHNASPSETSPALSIRCRAYTAHALAGQSSESDREHEEEEEEEEEEETERDDLCDPVEIPGTSSESSQGDEDTGGSDEGPDWESSKVCSGSPVVPDVCKKPRRRWSCRMDSLEVMVKSMLDLRQLEAFSIPGSSHKKGPASRLQGRDAASTSTLDDPAELEERIKTRRFRPHSDWLTSHLYRGSRGSGGAVLYPEGGGGTAALHGSQYLVKEQRPRQQQESRSPDSACSIGYSSREPSPDQARHDSDSVEPLSSDHGSSESERDDEKEEEEEEEVKRKETSMEEAMRALADKPEHRQKDFLKQNFEALQDDSTAERSRASRLSMSARFLARGSNNRRVPVFAMAQSPGQSAKPLVSRVRPLMEDGQGRSSENRGGASFSRLGDRLDSEVPEKGVLVRRPNSRKRGLTGGHLWKMSSPVSRAALFSMDRPTALQKCQSAQSLLFDDNCSQAPPGGGGGGGAPSPRPQFLSISQDSSRSASSLPSPSSPLSPLSPVALQPWEVPKLKSPLSYMNPTTSSMAKTSRSDSRGEAVQLDDEPGGPTGSKSPRALGAEAPIFTSSALSPLSRTLSSPSTPSSCSSPSSSCSQSGPLPSSPLPSAPCVAVSPNLGPAFSQNVPPSRIPLPKLPLSFRRSICLDTMTLPDCSSHPSHDPTQTGDPTKACDGTANTGNKPGLRKRLSLPLLVNPERDLVPESVKSRSSLDTASCIDGPPVSVQACSVTTLTSQSDTPITLETCKQAAADLHDSLRRVTLLYNKVWTAGSDVGEEQQQARRILTETMAVARAQLESLGCPTAPHGRAVDGDAGVSVESGARREENRTLALLEQYSELLLKSVEKKMDSRP